MREGTKMQPGDLVRIKRASIGVKADSVALIMERPEIPTDFPGETAPLLIVRLCAHRQRERRYLAGDLDVISSK